MLTFLDSSTLCEPYTSTVNNMNSWAGQDRCYVASLIFIYVLVLRGHLSFSPVTFRIEHLDRWCRDLKILYLQNNLIPKIGKLAVQPSSAEQTLESAPTVLQRMWVD